MTVPVLREVTHRIGEYRFQHNPERLWMDDAREWLVQVFHERSTDDTPWEGTKRLAINHASQQSQETIEIVVNWSTIQAIKDQLYPGRIAIEVYPPREKIVDVAPVRWLWVLPKSAYLPFNLATTKKTLTATE